MARAMPFAARACALVFAAALPCFLAESASNHSALRGAAAQALDANVTASAASAAKGNLSLRMLADSEGDPDCESLQKMEFGNMSVGKILSPMCSYWPFGEFPVKSASQAREVLEVIFKPNGVYDVVKTLSSKRRSGDDRKFCWRTELMRQEMVAGSEKVCPSPISSKEARDYKRLEEEDADKLRQGSWSCKKSQGPDTCNCEKQACTAIGGKQCVFPFFYNSKKYTSCTSDDSDRPWCATSTDSSGNYNSWHWDHAWDNCGPSCDEEGSSQQEAGTREDISAVLSVCDLEVSNASSVGGKSCYDKCPHGSEPVPESAICQTKCSQSNHYIECGYGCANTKMNCAKAVVDQIGVVVKAVAKFFGLLTGNLLVYEFFDAIVSLVDFVITTLPEVIDVFKRAWNALGGLTKDEMQAGIIFILFQLGADMQLSFTDKFLAMGSSIKNIQKMFKELLETEWEWSLFGGTDTDKITSVLEDFGMNEIIQAKEFMAAFQKPKCEPSNTTPVFTITGVGDERLMGNWMRQGWHLDRPRYRLIDDSNDPYTPMIHWSKRNYWRAFVDNPNHQGRETLYKNFKDQQTVPLDGWTSDEGANPAPTLQNM